MNKPLLISLLLTSTLGVSAFASSTGNSSSFPQGTRPAMDGSAHVASTTPAEQLQATPFSQRERAAMDSHQSAENKNMPSNHTTASPSSFRERTAG